VTGFPAFNTTRLTRHSRLAFHWRGERFDLQALSRSPNQTPVTLTRAATASPVDVNGNTRQANHYQPAWDIVDWDGDATRETPALRLGANDTLYHEYFAYQQALTLYVEFVENGTLGIASAAVIYLGNAGNTGARLWIDATGTFYRVRYHNGTTEVTSTLGTGPTTGQRVRLRATLASTGAVQIHQSINGAAETSASASGTNAIPSNATWSANQLYFNSTGDTNKGANLFVRVRLHHGTWTAAQMQEAW